MLNSRGRPDETRASQYSSGLREGKSERRARTASSLESCQALWRDSSQAWNCHGTPGGQRSEVMFMLLMGHTLWMLLFNC